MDWSTSPRVTSQDIDGQQPFTVTTKRPWSAIWIAFAAAMGVAAVDYVTLVMSVLFPGWVWCVTTGGLLLAAGVKAVFIDVESVRRERGSRPRDAVAKVVACVVVTAWALALWRELNSGCMGQECAVASQAVSLFVVFPVIPLAALTLIGYLMRRGRVGSAARVGDS
ncbi:hypothetical protein H9623_14955 [Oerskovia sp. Sa1BUA8]|uniref:Uncharacterized protein n=2 Tax=Oerskovia TaxID=162491 RepID=A0A9D5Z0W5_9CELL|nr:MULTISPECIES: hypothetical protein [Oerskovia]MBD7981500.1 hypothetical protein [Oerskovia merdavium]MBE7701589.1 hypothetical protein [Oerskovia douganii]